MLAPRNRFVLVKNEADLTRLMSLRPALLRQAQPLAASAEAFLLMRAAGVSSVSLPERLGDDSLGEIYCEARRLTREWYRPIAHELECESVDLGALVADDLFDFFLHATAADAAIRTLIGECGHVEFCLLPPAGIPCVWESAYTCRHNLIEAAIQNAARHGEAEISLIRPRPLWHPARLGRAAARRLRNVGRRVRGPQPSRTNGVHTPLPWEGGAIQRQPGERLALAVGNSLSLRTVFGYAPLLERGTGCRVLGASFDDVLPEIRDRTGLVVDRPYFRLKDVPAGALLSATLSGIATAHERFVESRLRSPEPALNNPFLTFQFDYVFTDLLPATLRAYTSTHEAIRVLEPELVLVAAHSFIEQGAVAAARRCDVPSVMITHGVLSWLQTVSAEHFWAWGELPKRILTDELGASATAVRVVGAPQLSKISEIAPQALSAHRAAVRRRLGVDDDAVMLVVLTSGVGEGPWQAVAPCRVAESWEALLQWTQQRPRVQLVIRPHPLADMHAWYHAMQRASPLKNVSVAREGPVEDIVAAADLALVMQNVTTAGLVAVQAGCPVVYVRSARRFDTPAEAAWSEAEGLTVVNTAGELADMLDRLLGDPIARSECLDRARQFLTRYVAESERLPERVRQAADDALEVNRARLVV